MDIQLSHNSIIKLQNELSKIDTLLKIKLSNLNKMESEQSPSKYKSYQSTIEIIKNEISGDNDKLHDTTNLINKESQILDKLLKDKDILGNKKIKLETDISILVINKIIFINQYL